MSPKILKKADLPWKLPLLLISVGYVAYLWIADVEDCDSIRWQEITLALYTGILYVLFVIGCIRCKNWIWLCVGSAAVFIIGYCLYVLTLPAAEVIS